jgi:hypothetical protein
MLPGGIDTGDSVRSRRALQQTPDKENTMAGRGPARTGKAVRRNKGPETITVKAPNKKYGWDLPKGVLRDKDGDPIAWHPMTKKWWDAWRSSPQATRMLTEPDWQFLLDTALMHHQMWQNGRWDFASEVRLRVAKFGATPEDRLRLHLEIDDEIDQNGSVGRTEGSVTDIDSRRKRLSS